VRRGVHLLYCREDQVVILFLVSFLYIFFTGLALFLHALSLIPFLKQIIIFSFNRKIPNGSYLSLVIVLIILKIIFFMFCVSLIWPIITLFLQESRQVISRSLLSLLVQLLVVRNSSSFGCLLSFVVGLPVVLVQIDFLSVNLQHNFLVSVFYLARFNISMLMLLVIHCKLILL
jgi:hypothetical protein